MRMQSIGRAMLGIAVVFVGAAAASAHFVWIESTAKDGQLLVRSGFGESGGWDPDLVEKIGQTKYWTRKSGKLEPLALPLDATEKEYRAKLSAAGIDAIIGNCDYGLAKFGPKPSHLRYTAKHLIGAPSAWKDTTPNQDLRIELLASHDGDAVKLQALFLGKPLAAVKIKASNPDGKEVVLTADADGVARWPLVGGGVYRCFVGTTTQEAGEVGGEKVEVSKDYTSLTFEIAGPKNEAKTAAKGEAK